MDPYQNPYLGYAMAPAQSSSSDSGCFRPDKAEDWEPYRTIIADMYRTMKLKDVMEEMERNYNFKGTVRQYKGKIKAWGLDNKYTKTGEYLEVLQDRQRQGSPSPGPAKTKGGREISESSLARFQKRAKKRGILADDSTSGSSSRHESGEQAAYDQGGYYPEEYYYSEQQYSDPAAAYQQGYQGSSGAYGGQWS